MLDGGAGRVLTSIPAFRKYKNNNPNSDFKIIVHWWDLLFYGEKDLINHIIPYGTKGMFQDYIKTRDLVVLEPYHMHDYYNGNISLYEAFDILVNNNKDVSLEKNYYHVLPTEKLFAENTIIQLKEKHKKSNVVVFQPFGSSSQVLGNNVVDNTSRSLNLDKALYLGSKLAEHSLVIYFGPENLIPADNPSIITLYDQKPTIRFFASIIEQADVFVGIDSLGQHFARSFCKKSFVLMGSTIERNVSYPDSTYFEFFRHNNIQPQFVPMRISDPDCSFANMHNDGIMDFSKEEMDNICLRVRDSFRHEHIRY